MFTNHRYLIYRNKPDLALNNRQWLIWCKTKPNFADGQDSPDECPSYDTKQSDGEALLMLELWRIRSIFLFSSLPSLLFPGVVAPDRVLSMGQIELFDI